jgi:hypothetical protein
MLTPQQAAPAVASAVAERDTIQQNLLDLDGSFGKRLLSGAALTGETKGRWEAATADLTRLWEIFTAYSAVVDRAAEMLPGVRRAGGRVLSDITAIFNAPSVRLPGGSSAVAQGNITGTAEQLVTMATAVREMRRLFASVADVVNAAETVWNALADQLQQVADDLAAAKERAGGIEDGVLAGALAVAEADLAQLRGVVTGDPLALSRRAQGDTGQVDTARLGRLRERAAAAVSRAAALAALRSDSDQRFALVAAAVTAARDAWQDAMAARERAAAKIAAVTAAPPDVHGLAQRLAGLRDLRAAGRWSTLSAELDALEAEASAMSAACRDVERRAAALLDRREELRGLLGAYQAKAARVGGAEDSMLEYRYDRARSLLWTAPCDLSAAADAVTGYQQAVLELERGPRP